MPIYKTAHFQVQPAHLGTAKEAITTFIDFIQANEPDTIIYTSVQLQSDETTFMHFMGFTDAAAEEKHRTSPGVMKFVDVLYPVTVDGVKFVDYDLLATTE